RDCLVESNYSIGGRPGSSGFGWDDPGVGRGGGLWNEGTANLLNSTFHGNRAVGGEPYFMPVGGWHAFGGGIFNTGTLTSANLTVASNAAQGGDYAHHPPMALPKSGGNGSGGGFFQAGGSILLTNATIAYNSAQGGKGMPPGGGFGDNFNTSNGTVLLRNCLIAGTAGGTNCVGTISDGGHNISSDSSCQFGAPGSLNDTDPKLAPLADYGGPTPTMALLPGSPALDAADAAACPPTDQRGRPRPFGPGCDIGAFESSPPYTVLGRITGFVGTGAEMHISIGDVSTVPDPDGAYIVHGFEAGTYIVTPASSAGVFIQSNSVVHLGPDHVVNFQCYRSNAVTLELSAPGVHRVVFAGEAGRTYRLMGSSELPTWLPLQTNLMSNSEIFSYDEADLGFPAQRFFKVLSP
ncbi:MAG TPA: choice-of-anchor Q domain-containing protein, partial [Candidatus Saccharimonadales bacterium]|nr:choice-of-anchor Q domain-containing protein [Candidatus Saccharimonadales bacterium]